MTDVPNEALDSSSFGEGGKFARAGETHPVSEELLVPGV